MIESVQLFHPRRWVEALARVEQAERRDAARKAKWWSLARKAVARLRSKYRFGRMMVIGDLPGPKKLNYWSELTLVVFDPIKESWVEIYRTLSKLGKRIRLDLVEAERATKEEHLAIEETGIDI